MIVLFWSRATRDLLRSFGWGIAALHRLHAATKLPRPRRPPHSVYRFLAGWVAATRLCAIPRPRAWASCRFGRYASARALLRRRPREQDGRSGNVMMGRCCWKTHFAITGVPLRWNPTL